MLHREIHTFLPAIERFVLQAVLTDTLLEEMLVVLLMLVRSYTWIINIRMYCRSCILKSDMLLSYFSTVNLSFTG